MSGAGAPATAAAAAGRAGDPRGAQARLASLRARALPARFDTRTALVAELSRDMRLAGPAAGAYVADLGARRTLFSFRGDVSRSPASNEKLYTTATALARFGPSGALTTRVLGNGGVDAQGIWHGNLYLRGGGDPTFGSPSFIQGYYGGLGTSVSQLAQALERAGIVKVDGSIVGDETFFDALRGTPPSRYAYDTDIGAPLTALSFDRGRANADGPAGYAASQLAAALRNGGVAVSGASSAGPTPPGATVLASLESPPMNELVALTNEPSDNFMAETLLKDLGAYFGAGGSTAAGAAMVRAWLAPQRLRPRLYDGSGLDRADHTSPHQIVALLRLLRPTAVGAALRASLPIAGQTGTLIHRMRHTAAAGRCRAKTGTLSDVSALSGYCTSAGGDEIAFSFLMNGLADVTLARTLQDRMAASLAACAAACASRVR